MNGRSVGTGNRADVADLGRSAGSHTTENRSSSIESEYNSFLRQLLIRMISDYKFACNENKCLLQLATLDMWVSEQVQ